MKITSAGLLLILASATLCGQITVSTILPAAGLTRGGEVVHIHGTNLLTTVAACPGAACPTAVTFGDALATIIDNTATEIVVFAPPHLAGPVSIEVNVPPAAQVTIASGYGYQDAPSSDRVRLLAPMAISSAGALNTSWTSELTIYNGNGEDLLLSGPTAQPTDSALKIPAFSSAGVTLHPPAGNPGAFVYVPRRLVDNIVANLRVHETTRDNEGWGTEIPVIAETQFRPSSVLINIPNDTRFRTLLRVYSYAANDTSAMLSLRDEATGELIDTRSIVLQLGLTTTTSGPEAPAYTQVALDSLLGRFISTHARIRAEITPLATNAPPLWAFVAITNNVTQQVTTITPTPTLTPLSVPTPSKLAVGHWGGDSSCIDVTETEVNMTFPCGGGTFSPPTLEADRHFEVDGTTQIIVGPGVPGQGSPAHFSGVLQGTAVTVTVRSGNTTLGPFTMQLASPGNCGHPCP